MERSGGRDGEKSSGYAVTRGSTLRNSTLVVGRGVVGVLERTRRTGTRVGDGVRVAEEQRGCDTVV